MRGKHMPAVGESFVKTAITAGLIYACAKNNIGYFSNRYLFGGNVYIGAVKRL